MRAKKFMQNGIIIIICQCLYYFMEFLCRTVFIRTLPLEYQGIQGLFTNILTLLSLSELGIGSVIIFNMYKPFAENDRPRILALISFYRSAYRAVACIVAGAGLILTPFLPYLIKDCPDIPDLSLIYLLYVANSALSYLFSYKQSLFLVDQKLYVTTVWSSFFSILRDILRIIFLYATHSFILYLLLQIVFTLLGNLTISRRAEKCYPYLKEAAGCTLDKGEKKLIYKNIFAMFNHRIGLVILNSTDNLLISRMIGLTSVAINNNYSLIITMVNQFVTQIFSALMGGVGNLLATESKAAAYQVFKTLYFSSFWFYTFCSSCLFVLLNPFIRLVWGAQYLFPMHITAILCVNFYIAGIRRIPITFKESMGLLRQDRYKPLIEALLNLVISILAARYCGVFGIFAGSFFSMVLTSLWVEPYVLFHCGFHMSWKEFWLTSIQYYAVSFLTAAATYAVGSLYSGTSFAAFLYRTAACLLVPNLLLLALYHRSPVFHNLMQSLNLPDLLRRRNHR